MSNFICSECGMNNIDCGGAGYKTPKEIELEKENKRLQAQLKESNELIKECCKRIDFRQTCLTSFPPKFKTNDYLYNELEDYFKKYGINWGVK